MAHPFGERLIGPAEPSEGEVILISIDGEVQRYEVSISPQGDNTDYVSPELTRSLDQFPHTQPEQEEGVL